MSEASMGALLTRSNAAKDVEILTLRHEVAVLRHTNALLWGSRTPHVPLTSRD